FNESSKTAFGGDLLKKSHAKVKRPFSPKASMHFVLKANKYVLKHYDQRVEKLIRRQAKKHFVKIYHLANPGNHIHLVLKVKDKNYLKAFLRSICGLIPRLLKQTKLWMQRPFSRILHWGKAFQT